MKAARIHQYGDPDVFQIEDVPAPTCGPRDVLVKVHASSVNPIDYKIRMGGQRAVIRPNFPAILGMDLSGVVEAVGEKVTRFAPGDEVIASPSHRRMGTYAELIAVREDELARKPPSISHEEAASLPLVALTAWDALVGMCNLKADQRVLIQAGSGGVGSIAIQLAKHLGAEVFTTCSPRNFELVESLGADRPIDYRTQDYQSEAAGVDAILEAIGGEHVSRAVRTVRRGGRVAAITAGLPTYTAAYGPALGFGAVVGTTIGRMTSAYVCRGVVLRMVTRSPSGANLQAIADLVDEGAIRPVIDRVFPLDEIADAHRYVETGRA
ncbi:MAG: NADP-dependent oxidoreductase, partial [Myxococcota bacterium]